MLKKVIKFEDYDGKEVSQECCFHLDPEECISMNLDYEREGGLIGHLQNLMSELIDGRTPQKPMIDFVKMMVKKAYGIRPKDDPTLFLKEDDEGRSYGNRFAQSRAYKTYVYNLLTGEESLEEFATGVLPHVSDEQMEAAKEQMKEEAPALAAVANAGEG